MFSLFIFFYIFIGQSIDPPVWPNVWSQQFGVNYSTESEAFCFGKHWYDYENGNERVTYQNGQYDSICGSVLPGVKAVCTQLVTKGNLYIIYPQKSQCCRCCDGAAGCVVKNPHWLAGFTFVGEETLSGESFYKWTAQNIINYYAQKTEKLVPRRISIPGLKTEDFLINTYSQQAISKEIFELPIYCRRDCSRDTICGKLQPKEQLS